MGGAGERKPFKSYFDRSAAALLAAQVGAVWPAFDQTTFVALATRDLEALEFADRVRLFADSLHACLPNDVERALAILTESLPPALADCEQVTDGWLQWPVGQFIADRGLEHWDESMDAMTELTQRFSSEFAVRPFVDAYTDKTMARLLSLTRHDNPHVRRWCSEGPRPRLPWAMVLRDFVADPSPLWPILDALKDDPEIYVRRSVANCINDIAKDHPDEVVARCKRWAHDSNPGRDWVIHRALRTLVKDGHRGALAVLGYGEPRNLLGSLSTSPETISVGGKVALVAKVQNKARERAKLMVDYIVHYVRQGGKESPKVFKWTTLELGTGEVATLEKNHSMRKTSVRALYPGRHRIELQVNGTQIAHSAFVLEPGD